MVATCRTNNKNWTKPGKKELFCILPIVLWDFIGGYCHEWDVSNKHTDSNNIVGLEFDEFG